MNGQTVLLTATEWVNQNPQISLWSRDDFVERMQPVVDNEHRLFSAAIGVTFENLSNESKQTYNHFLSELLWGYLKFPAYTQEEFGWRETIYDNASGAISEVTY